MGFYRKKPVVIEAIKFKDWPSAVEIMNWTGCVQYVPQSYDHPLRNEREQDKSNGHILNSAPAFMMIPTLEGTMRADLGDWIIKGVQGEVYPCKPDIFEATYEPAED